MSEKNTQPLYKSTTRLRFANSYEIGVFCRLTNNYALVAPGGSNRFYYALENALPEEMPIIETSIGGCRIVGRLSAGNKHGLLLPSFTTDTELKRISEALPELVEVKCIEEKMSALGNVIVCNDRIAMVHVDVDQETREIMADTLNLEVFTNLTPSIELPGAYTIVTNYGGLVCPKVPQPEVEELSSVFNIPIHTTTINGSGDMIGSGMAANDLSALIGSKTWYDEANVIYKLLPSHSPDGIQYQWRGYFAMSVIENTLPEELPIIKTSIGGCRIVGRLSAGNKHGLLLPSFTTESELKHISKFLPESVEVKCIEEKMSETREILQCIERLSYNYVV